VIAPGEFSIKVNAQIFYWVSLWQMDII